MDSRELHLKLLKECATPLMVQMEEAKLHLLFPQHLNQPPGNPMVVETAFSSSSLYKMCRDLELPNSNTLRNLLVHYQIHEVPLWARWHLIVWAIYRHYANNSDQCNENIPKSKSIVQYYANLALIMQFWICSFVP